MEHKLRVGQHGPSAQIAIKMEGRGLVALMGAGSDATRNEDADELVKRWNQHPDLLSRVAALEAALEKALSTMEYFDVGEGEGDAQDQARQALNP